MKLSISASLLACLFAFALLRHVQAGFCDHQGSGRFCRTKHGHSTSTFCSCYYKKKGKRECDNGGDERCENGCRNGHCSRSDAICAKFALNDMTFSPIDDTKTYTLKNMCPTVTSVGYRTWENRRENSLDQERQYFAAMIGSNTAWSKALLLPQFYTSNAKNATKKSITKAWDNNCRASDVQQAHCLTYFPKCVQDRGDNSGCLQYCASMMQCVDRVEAACNAAAANPAVCNAFPTFGPRGGSKDCNNLCKEYQNDFIRANSHQEGTTDGTVGAIIGVILAVIAGIAITFWQLVKRGVLILKR